MPHTKTRDSSVSIVAGLRVGRCGFRSQSGERYLCVTRSTVCSVETQQFIDDTQHCCVQCEHKADEPLSVVRLPQTLQTVSVAEPSSCLLGSGASLRMKLEAEHSPRYSSEMQLQWSCT